MQNITVGRYTTTLPDGSPVDNGYAGWIEPEDRSWIVFVRSDHSAEVYLCRDPETGAVIE